MVSSLTPPGMDDNTSSGDGDNDAWGHTSNDMRDMHRLGKKQEVCLNGILCGEVC